jgi:hypothetical protein
VNDEARRPWEQRASATPRTWRCRSGENCFIDVWKGLMVQFCEMQFLGFS